MAPIRCCQTAVWHSDAARGPSTPSFDHLVGAGDEGRRNAEAERVSGLEVDTECEFSRLLDWQVGRHGPLENLVDKVGRAVTQLDKINPIGRQSARRREF